MLAEKRDQGCSHKQKEMLVSYRHREIVNMTRYFEI